MREENIENRLESIQREVARLKDDVSFLSSGKAKVVSEELESMEAGIAWLIKVLHEKATTQPEQDN